MKKRLISLILALCACTLLLSSCGQNEAEAAAADLLDNFPARPGYVCLHPPHLLNGFSLFYPKAFPVSM